MICTNQPIPLETSFVDADGIDIDLTSSTIRYDYWLPTNDTIVPSGNVAGSINGDPTLGRATGTIPSSAVTEQGTKWRVQAIAILGGEEFPASTITFTVQNRGT